MQRITLILLSLVLLGFGLFFFLHGNNVDIQTFANRQEINPEASTVPERDAKTPKAGISVDEHGEFTPIAFTKISASSTNAVYVTKVGGKSLPVQFEDSDISSDLAEAITKDIETLLLTSNKLEWKKMDHSQERGSLVFTHKLIYRQEVETPRIFHQCFGLGITIEGEPQLLIPQELIDAYEMAFQRKQHNPVMFEKIKGFLTLLDGDRGHVSIIYIYGCMEIMRGSI